MIADELTTLTHGGNRQEANLLPAITRARAALLMAVSERTVTTAHTITDPDLRAEVKSGKKKLPAAAKEQKARGPKKTGKPVKPLTNAERDKIVERKRKRSWKLHHKGLLVAVHYIEGTIRLFKENSTDCPTDLKWCDLVEQISEAVSELKAAIP
jgi:hypothetical protein